MLRASILAICLLTAPACAQEFDIDAALVQLMNPDGNDDPITQEEDTGTPNDDAGTAESDCPPERDGSCPELLSDEDYADWLLDNEGPTDKAYYVQWLSMPDEDDDKIPGGVQHNGTGF